MTTIIFEAHSTTEDNEAKVSSGWNDVALSARGEQQAREMGERYIGQKFDVIFCSDMQRSYKTAQLAFGGKYPIIQDERLRECDYGELTQAPKHEVESRKPSAITTPFPGGESYQDTSRRMRAFLQDLAKDYDGKTVMIIGHRATQYGLDEWVRGLSLEQAVLGPWAWQPGWRYELDPAALHTAG